MLSHHRDGTTVTFQLEGVLDAMSAPSVERELDEALGRGGPARVVFDLSSLRLIDSRGIAVLVATYKRARATGRRVTVTGLRNQPLLIFKLLRLDRVLCDRPTTC
jgi:anti-anti-sigma factor